MRSLRGDAADPRPHLGDDRPEALDHLQQLTAVAKDLLSDFREVKQNSR